MLILKEEQQENETCKVEDNDFACGRWNRIVRAFIDSLNRIRLSICDNSDLCLKVVIIVVLVLRHVSRRSM